MKHAADARAAHGVAFDLHLGLQLKDAVVLAVMGKRFAHGYLLNWLDRH